MIRRAERVEPNHHDPTEPSAGSLVDNVRLVRSRPSRACLDGRVYLRVGDEVNHRRYPQWGTGVVVEAWASTLGGGLCLVRIVFTDGQERSFINNLDDQNCCYYAGLRITSS